MRGIRGIMCRGCINEKNYRDSKGWAEYAVDAALCAGGAAE